MPKREKLFVFEGPDGSGKTALSHALAESLNATGVRCAYFAFPGQNVGTLGKLVHDLHHSTQSAGIRALTPTSLQLLHIAAHIDAIEAKILPTLRNGLSVVLDRFWWSTLVYGKVGGANPILLQKMVEVEHASWGTQLPTSVFLITRSDPIGCDATAEWKAISDEYGKLAERESDRYPVWRIRNEGDLADVLSQVLDRIHLGEELSERK